jgi:hypothetical protein
MKKPPSQPYVVNSFERAPVATFDLAIIYHGDDKLLRKGKGVVKLT